MLLLCLDILCDMKTVDTFVVKLAVGLILSQNSKRKQAHDVDLACRKRDIYMITDRETLTKDTVTMLHQGTHPVKHALSHIQVFRIQGLLAPFLSDIAIKDLSIPFRLFGNAIHKKQHGLFPNGYAIAFPVKGIRKRATWSWLKQGQPEPWKFGCRGNHGWIY